MKKVVLLACVMVVSGFASNCSSILSYLQRDIDDYNKKCVQAKNFYGGTKSMCERLEEQIREQENRLNQCRERRNDDIARKFKYR